MDNKEEEGRKNNTKSPEKRMVLVEESLIYYTADSGSNSVANMEVTSTVELKNSGIQFEALILSDTE